MKDLWPVLSLAVNVVMALGIFALRSTIRIAILEALQTVAREYATQREVEKLRAELIERLDLAERMDAGFAKVHNLFSRRPAAGQGAPQ